MQNLLHIIVLSGVMELAVSLMYHKDFKGGTLQQCYSPTSESFNLVNGQTLPVPSAIETFVSLMERLETSNPNIKPVEIIKKLFLNFRIDDLPSGLNKIWSLTSKDFTDLERVLFNIPKTMGSNNNFEDYDFSSDEQCALHFMLSHSVNESLHGNGNEETIEDGLAKFPRELGVVSIGSRPQHAVALGKVLLGIWSGLSGSNLLDATDIFAKWKAGEQDSFLNGLKINRLHGVTFGGLIAVTVNKNFKRNNIVIQPNGQWNDVPCTMEYKLEENKKKHLTSSLLRGAIDGLIIGNTLEKNPEMSQKLRLSQILRMYYGSEGLAEGGRVSSSGSHDLQWCNRRRNLENLSPQLREEMTNFNKLYSTSLGTHPEDTIQEDINALISFIHTSSSIIDDVNDGAACSFGSDMTSIDKKCATPYSLFPILDINAPVLQKSFQIELLGNLSVNFDVRPHGNTIGAYANIKPLLGRGLDVIANNSGIAGCAACFARYYGRRSNKLDDVDLMERLNQTLTDYEKEFYESLNNLDESGVSVPSKVVLLFNYQNQVNNDQRLRDAIWEIEKNFRELTILGIGSRKDTLGVFTMDDDTDTFTESSNPAEFSNKLKTRICKVPAEFQYKECNQRRSGKIDAYIPLGKLQYWAMYPKYFLKSYRIYMKFVPLDGAQIRVCFSRSFSTILDPQSQYADCKDSSSEEIKFEVKNPCYKFNEYNCAPFYFVVEGKKVSNTICESPRCRATSDIQFEFQHEGISCNKGNSFSFSFTWLLLSFLLSLTLKQ